MNRIYLSSLVFMFLLCSCSSQKKESTLQMSYNTDTIFIDSIGVDSVEMSNRTEIKDDSLSESVKNFIKAPEFESISETELIAGFKFGMSKKQYVTHCNQLTKLECDQFLLKINGISFYATDGMQSYFKDELYDFHIYLSYKTPDWTELSGTDFDILTSYFKSIYGVDSLHYMCTETPASEFLTHHWRKNNMYFRISWIPENEVPNTIELEYLNGPLYKMKCTP